jgi:hypothetical protein
MAKLTYPELHNTNFPVLLVKDWGSSLSSLSLKLSQYKQSYNMYQKNTMVLRQNYTSYRFGQQNAPYILRKSREK